MPAINDIPPLDSTLPAEIRPGAEATAAPTNIQGNLPQETVGAAPTESTSGLLTETAPLTTSTHVPKPTSTLTPTPITVSVTNSATPSSTAAASSGISPGKLTAAIVVPIAVLAILIPLITYWILTHKRKLQEQKDADQRGSYSSAPMIQKQPLYREPPPIPLAKAPSQSQLTYRPFPGVQTRDSLGLFNFELSPTRSTSPPASQDSETSSPPGFSIARAMEMRRSHPSIVSPHARTADSRVSRADSGRPPTRGSNSISRSNPFEPPPPYASPPPPEAAAARSHFAPLSRIGSRHVNERSPPRMSPLNDAAEPDRSTYASSSVVSPENHDQDQAHSRSSSPSLDWPSPPRAQEAVVARKPIPNQSPRITSHATSPQMASPPNNASSHLDGPFEAYLPDRISDVSGFSIDTSRWEDHPRQESTVSSLGMRLGSDDESSTIHPHTMV